MPGSPFYFIFKKNGQTTSFGHVPKTLTRPSASQIHSHAEDSEAPKSQIEIHSSSAKSEPSSRLCSPHHRRSEVRPRLLFSWLVLTAGPVRGSCSLTGSCLLCSWFFFARPTRRGSHVRPSARGQLMLVQPWFARLVFSSAKVCNCLVFFFQFLSFLMLGLVG